MSRRPGIALTAAALGALGLAIDWVLAFHVGFTQRADRHVLEGFAGLDRGPLATLADVVPHLSDPQPFTLLSLLVVAVALARGRRAAAAALVLVGSNLCTQWLQPALAARRPTSLGAPVDVFLWPSGHATASMALCLAAVIVAPASRRPLVAGLGAAYSLAVTFSLLVAAWHFPSDVIAGYLMAGIWTSVVVAALWARDARAGMRAQSVGGDVRTAVAPAVVVAALGVAVAVLVALARPDAVAEYVRAHTTFVVGAGLIAALGLSLAAALSAAMTSKPRAPRRR